ncbi:hypothetical protein J6590_079737 [Homalodisca vitripennis]|nr:hypothetical protein J6590_079737 [Homalodisca vitripennis]
MTGEVNALWFMSQQARMTHRPAAPPLVTRQLLAYLRSGYSTTVYSFVPNYIFRFLSTGTLDGEGGGGGMAASPSPQSSPMPPPQVPSPMGPPQQAPSPMPSPSAQNTPAMGPPQHHPHSPTNYNQGGPPPGPITHMNGPSAMQQGTQTFQQHSMAQTQGQQPVQVSFI